MRPLVLFALASVVGCRGVSTDTADCVYAAYYIDSDGDGFPGEVPQWRCEEPEGAVQTTSRLDCDDDDPARHPDAVEVCDGLDNNCSGLSDEDLWAFRRAYPITTPDSVFGPPDTWTDDVKDIQLIVEDGEIEALFTLHVRESPTEPPNVFRMPLYVDGDEIIHAGPLEEPWAPGVFPQVQTTQGAQGRWSISMTAYTPLSHSAVNAGVRAGPLSGPLVDIGPHGPMATGASIWTGTHTLSAYAGSNGLLVEANDAMHTISVLEASDPVWMPQFQIGDDGSVLLSALDDTGISTWVFSPDGSNVQQNHHPHAHRFVAMASVSTPTGFRLIVPLEAPLYGDPDAAGLAVMDLNASGAALGPWRTISEDGSYFHEGLTALRYGNETLVVANRREFDEPWHYDGTALRIAEDGRSAPWFQVSDFLSESYDIAVDGEGVIWIATDENVRRFTCRD